MPKEVRERLNEVRDRVIEQHQQQQDRRAQGFEKYAWAMHYQRNEMMDNMRENVLNPIINQQDPQRTETLRQELRDAMKPTPEPKAQNPERSQDSVAVQESEREQHSQTLTEYLKNTTFQGAQKHIEFIRDYGQAAVVKAAQTGRNIFDRFAAGYASEVQQQQERERGRERDYER